jgi:hypothetical protein
MYTFIKAVAVALALVFGVAATASAASFTNVEFSNGDVTIQGTGGSTVTAKVRIVVPANEVVERIQWDVVSDNLAPVCVDVGGDKGLEEGTHFVDLQVKLPPNTGTYTLAVQGSGIFGAFRTVDCTANVVGSASFSGALKVVGGSSSTGGTGSSDKVPFVFKGTTYMVSSEFKMILDIVLASLGGADNAKPAYCASLVVYNGSNASAAQASLLATPHASAFHAAGVYAPTGYWGPISISAAAAAANACK